MISIVEFPFRVRLKKNNKNIVANCAEHYDPWEN